MPVNPPTIPSDTPAWEYEEIEEKLLALDNNEISRFLIFSYATAARQEEALKAKVEKVEVFEKPDKMHIKLPIAKIKVRHAEKTIVLNPNKNSFEKFLFEKIVEQKYYWQKNNNKIADGTPENEQTLFFNFKEIKLQTKKNYARRWAVKFLGCNHHFLRHCRLTHLTNVFDYNEYDLIAIAGWTNIQPATSYIKTKVRDIEKKMGVE